jgi:cytochrome P450
MTMQHERSNKMPPEWFLDFDMWSDEGYHADPYPQLDELRERCPVARSDAHGGYWMLTDYESVYACMKDDEHFSHAVSTVPSKGVGEVQIPISLDPPEHGPWRMLLTPSFSPGQIKLIEPTVREAATRLLEPIAERGECEFMTEFAEQLPVAAILPLIGLPMSELDTVLGWEAESLKKAQTDPTAREVAYNTTRPAIREYFEDKVHERIATGPVGKDVLSTLVGAKVHGRTPTVPEIVNICTFLLSAGLHTTTATLGNSVLYLSQHHEDRDRLTADPALIPRAVEELMRWEGLVTTGRLCVREVELGGQVLREGEPVLLSIPSALRDEGHYERPDVVDFDRPVSATLAFGVGIHRCLGSHLARMELRVALEEIHRTIPNYRLAPGAEVRRHTAIHRTTENLPLLTG